MASSSLATWNLTASSSVLISELRRATGASGNDNVQVKALVACEAIGANFALSEAKSRIVNDICSKYGKTFITAYLPLQVGWGKDSAHYLAQSEAGLRFLGIAAALITMDHWHAAQALSQFISDTAEDKTLVPTAAQVKHLLEALQHRLWRSGFNSEIQGCKGLVESTFDIYIIDQKTPSVETLTVLLRVLATLGRLGVAGRRVRMQVPFDQSAWIMALVKWCLGELPTLTEHGDTILTGSSSFHIDIQDMEEPFIQLSLFEDIEKLVELVTELPSGDRAPGGLMSFATYGKRMMEEIFGDQEDPEYGASTFAIPFACALAMQGLSTLNVESVQIPSTSSLLQPDNSIAAHAVRLFDFNSVQRTMRAFLGDNSAIIPKDSHEKLSFDFRKWLSVTRALGNICRCSHCHVATKIFRWPGSGCNFSEVLWSVSSCVATILAVSLLRPLQDSEIFIRYEPYVPVMAKFGFPSLVHDTMSGSDSDLKVWYIIKHLLQLLGHKIPDDKYSWIMSSQYGQCVWPEVFESSMIDKASVLRLKCATGGLDWDGEQYDQVIRPKNSRSGSNKTPPTSKHDKSSTRPQPIDTASFQIVDAYKGMKPVWRISSADEKVLTLFLSCDGLPGIPDHDPFNILEAAKQLCFVNCPHDRYALSWEHDYTVSQTSPQNPEPSTSEFGIVQTDSNYEMRFFTLAANVELRAIVREDSCLQCCLAIGRHLGSSVIIC